MTDKKENSIDPELDKFEEMFDSEENLELEKKLEELIDKEIKKRIVRTTKSTLLKLALVGFSLVLIVNPLVKSFYPNFNDLSSNEDKPLYGLESYKNALVEKIENLFGIYYYNNGFLNDGYNDSKLKHMVGQFISNTNPYALINYLGVKDKGFGKYEFHLGFDDILNGSKKNNYSIANSGDVNIYYTRGKSEKTSYQSHRYLYDYTAYSDSYIDKKQMIDEIVGKLPDSSQVFASIKLKEPQSILELTKKLDKDFESVPFWLRVVSPDEYMAIEKEDEAIKNSKKDTHPENMYTELGINMVFPYKTVKKKNKYKDIDGEEYSLIKTSLHNELNTLTEKYLKNEYLKQIDLIYNNINIFNVFCQIPHSRDAVSQDSKFGMSASSMILEEVPYAQSVKDYGPGEELNKYINSIKKSDKIKTNLFTIVIDKNKLIKLLKEDYVEGATILDEKSSAFFNR